MSRVTFDHIVRRRVDLFAVDPGKRTMQIGYRLTFYLFRVELRLAPKPKPGMPDPTSVGSTTVKEILADDLDLSQIALAATASKRTRKSLARVVVEDSTRGPYYTEMRRLEAQRDAHGARDARGGLERDYGMTFTGYRLRDPKTNHTWLTFGINARGSHTVREVFDYTPPPGGQS